MRLFHNCLILAASCIALCGFAIAGPQSAPDPKGVEYFEKRVRPLLAERCYSCHNGAKKITQGGLALDSPAGFKKGGGRGIAIVPGDPDKSLLIRAVRYTGDIKMPPGGKLADREIALLSEWIRLGAPAPAESSGAKKPRALTLEEGRRWWAFVPLRQPAVPAVPRSSSIQTWSRNAIDRFILAKLAQKGLRPNPPADKRTLIRRAHFDLIGLPPTPEEVDAFVKDPAPDAYEKVIDRLLANPHYGERWGRHWLDLARFAESHGYEQDYDRPNAYWYRDFMIRALNEDMPYDQFVKWQLAGDEFEPENPMALMATGFLAAGTHATQITKNQVEKERYDELDDMLAISGTSMLGLTFGCARCHDHKFDPIPNRDYYRMLSTFTTTVRSDYDVNMDPEGYRTQKAAFDIEHEPLLAARDRYDVEKLPGKLHEWLKLMARAEWRPKWTIPEIKTIKSTGGATFAQLEDGSLLFSGPNPANDIYTIAVVTLRRGIRAIRLEALAHPSFVKGGPGRAANGNFALSDFSVTAEPTVPIKGATQVKLVLKNPRVDFEQPSQLIRDSNGKDKNKGWAIDPQFGKDHAAVFEVAEPVGYEGGTILTFTLRFDHPNASHAIGRPRISLATEPGMDLGAGAWPENVERLVSGPAIDPAKLADKDRDSLLTYFRSIDPERQRLNHIVQEHLDKAPQPPLKKVLISSEGVPAVRTHTQGGDFLDHTWFLKRGDPNQKGEVAAQSFLQVLMRDPSGEKRWQEVPPKGCRTSYQRRALANWITDVDHGAGHLLARVIVNRLWQHHFGRGIVATPSDFGTQGERPSHPELLDWLANELIQPSAQRPKSSSSSSSIPPDPKPRTPWSLKQIHRLIMASATYMQSAANSPASLKIDPQNKLCWRHSRQRLEAEIIRDSMLSVSGLLDQTMFGPGTLDETMKRRSIYFFVKRSRLIPTMILFDAPNALGGMSVRPSTTVAPQALMMMNNQTVRECARALSNLVAPKDASNPAESVESAYRVALARPPTAKEKADSIAFLRAQSDLYRAANKPDADSLALTDFCQVVLGINEFVYVE